MCKKKEEKQIIICMIEKFIRISFSILTMNNNNWPSGFVQQLHLTGWESPIKQVQIFLKMSLGTRQIHGNGQSKRANQVGLWCACRDQGRGAGGERGPALQNPPERDLSPHPVSVRAYGCQSGQMGVRYIERERERERESAREHSRANINWMTQTAIANSDHHPSSLICLGGTWAVDFLWVLDKRLRTALFRSMPAPSGE